tara:strand:- start:24158 stop:24868 length:711 start_codon:yes stop_codon:yes gene_type:complete
MDENIPVVILCGGRGTRLREQTEFMPKPLVEIGNKPILWHIMKIYSSHGYNNFIICLGYKGDMIKDYFNGIGENWKVTLVDTGLDTTTGGRIKKIEPHIKTDHFMCTYGDGVADIDIKEVMNFHLSKGKMATVTGVHPHSKYGVLEFDKDNIVFHFTEKPLLESWVNGGFFIFNREIFDFIKENLPLEQDVLPKISWIKELAMFKFSGTWYCMDTYKDYLDLNKIWKEGNAEWKIW